MNIKTVSKVGLDLCHLRSADLVVDNTLVQYYMVLTDDGVMIKDWVRTEHSLGDSDKFLELIRMAVIHKGELSITEEPLPYGWY